jgi:hypothetical protein
MSTPLSIAALITVVTIAPAGQTTAPAAQGGAAPARGIYLERAEGGPSAEPMTASIAEDTRASGGMKMMFGGRPNVILTIGGDAAALRLPPEPSFIIVLTGGKMSRGEMPDLAELSMNAPSPITKEGKDFFIARLIVKDGSRDLDSKKGKVPGTVEKIGDRMFRLKPSKPLEPGEYAVALEAAGMPTGQMWDFGVGAR